MARTIAIWLAVFAFVSAASAQKVSAPSQRPSSAVFEFRGMQTGMTRDQIVEVLHKRDEDNDDSQCPKVGDVRLCSIGPYSFVFIKGTVAVITYQFKESGDETLALFEKAFESKYGAPQHIRGDSISPASYVWRHGKKKLKLAERCGRLIDHPPDDQRCIELSDIPAYMSSGLPEI